MPLITRESPDSPDAISLIAELDATLAPLYPTESRHGYSVEKLLAQQVHFFILRHDNLPAACAGLQFFPTFAELKRMYVRPPFRGQGFAKALLSHLATHALSHHTPTLRLETGIHQHEAIHLYERAGFTPIPPFPPYKPDPLSRCYEKHLA